MQSIRMPTDPPRRLTDAQALAALASPARQSILDALAARGPATVGMLAERTKLAPGSVSHHIGILARHGFVVEAAELARDRREHWWQGAGRSYAYSADDFTSDDVARAIATTAEAVNFERHVRIMRDWLATRGEPDHRTGGSFSSDVWLQLTDAEVSELGAEIRAILVRWARRERPAVAEGDERRAVFALAHLVPEVRPR